MPSTMSKWHRAGSKWSSTKLSERSFKTKWIPMAWYQSQAALSENATRGYTSAGSQYSGKDISSKLKRIFWRHFYLTILMHHHVYIEWTPVKLLESREIQHFPSFIQLLPHATFHWDNDSRRPTLDEDANYKALKSPVSQFPSPRPSNKQHCS